MSDIDDAGDFFARQDVDDIWRDREAAQYKSAKRYVVRQAGQQILVVDRKPVSRNDNPIQRKRLSPGVCVASFGVNHPFPLHAAKEHAMLLNGLEEQVALLTQSK